MLEKLRERKKQMWKKQSDSAETFKEDLRFQVVWESIIVVEKQVGLSFKDGVTVDRAVIAESLGTNTGEDTGLPGEWTSPTGEGSARKRAK